MSKKPIHEIRLGRIKAAIWENEAENGVRYNVTIDIEMGVQPPGRFRVAVDVLQMGARTI